MTLQNSNNKGNWFSKKPVGLTIILIIVGAALNFAISNFTAFVLKIPLFLDTIFTIAILFYCGIIPAILTAVIHSIPSSLLVNAPFYILFSLCSVAIILITYGVMKNNDKRNQSVTLTILYLILAALLSGFASSVIGGTIHTLGLILYPEEISEIVTEKFVLSLFSKNGSLLLSAILGRIPSTCIDRVITTLLGYGLYELLLKIEKKFR